MSIAEQWEQDVLAGPEALPLYTEYEAQLIRNTDKRRDRHDWAKQDYKVYPSGLSFGDCPRKFVESQKVYSGPNPTLTKYTNQGNGVHYAYQMIIARSPACYQGPICIPSEAHVKDMMYTLNNKYPEQPIRDLESGVSGRVDMKPIKLAGQWTFIDFKSTEEDFETFKSRKKIPKDMVTQLSIYCHLANKLELYPFKIERMGIMWIHRTRPTLDRLRHKEIYQDFTPELDARTANLLEHVGLHRRLAMKGQSAPCQYSECRDHLGAKPLKTKPQPEGEPECQ